MENLEGLEVGNGHHHELPELIKAVLDAAAGRELADHGYIPLHPDHMKRTLEDILEANEIELLYATLPIQILEQEGKVRGLVVANKSGRQVIHCKALIDTTITAMAATLSGAPVYSHKGGESAVYRRTLEFTGVGDVEEVTISVPAELKVKDHRIFIRKGCHGAGHRYVEYSTDLNSDNTLLASRDRELAVRHQSMELASYLVHHIPAFQKAVFAAASHELLGPFSINAAPRNISSSSNSEPSKFLERYATRIQGAVCLGKALWHGDSDLLDAVRAARLGGRIAEIWQELEEYWHTGNHSESKAVPSTASNPISADHSSMNLVKEAELAELHVPSWISPLRYKDSEDLEEQAIPLLKQADVLVVGGGTSGANASIIAAREGMNTVLLELNPGLGGTGTLGGVDSYWFGKRHGYAAAINEEVLAVQQEIRYKGAKWNIEAKMEALLRDAEAAGVEMMFNVITFGAIKSGDRVCGAVVATRWGAFAVSSETVIDATGDGDIAAYAGAQYVYGSAKDSTVMWYSLAQFQTPSKLQNNFTSMVDVSDIHDYTRAILAGRRRGSDCHDHGIYIATRESRHIIGDVTMTLTDQLLHRKWPDVINIHFSNHDVKGVSGADWVNVGMIPPNLDIEIPYRMLLPQGLEGILVVGKAISATHDALPAIRMQSDLENLGGVAALAASLAVKTKTTPRRIELEALQARLVQEDLLPPSMLTRELAPMIYTEQGLEELAESIETKPLYDYPNMRMNEVFRSLIPFVEICSAGSRIIPVLERTHQQADGVKKIRIAQALAMLGTSSGNQTLIEAIMEHMQGPELPVRTVEMMYVQLPPDHGAMPDAAYLLYSLAQAPDKACLPVWKRVADLLLPDAEAFKDTYKGIYYFVDAVCRGAERLGDRAAVPILEQLHRNPLFYRQHNSSALQRIPENEPTGAAITSLGATDMLSSFGGVQPDYFLERRSMLELAIGRALARCGSRTGYEILLAYLYDDRSLLSKNALIELQRISGKRIDKQPLQWKSWIEEARPYEQTYPLELRLDVEENSESLLRVEV